MTESLVVVPTYNERPNLPSLVRGLIQHAGLRILIVDDQSPDGTGDLADALAREYSGRIQVLHRLGPRGVGRSYIDGIKLAIAQPVEFVRQLVAGPAHGP